MSRLIPLLTAALALLSGPAFAAKGKVWHHCAPSQYDKAQIRGAVVSNEGVLRLSRQLQPLADLDAAHVWDVAEDKAGNLYVATGDDGKLFKVTPDGKSTIAYQSEDGQILCLARASDGSIYAGTGPGGRILRVAPDGETKVFAKTPESYVWCLALDADGETLYAGTGPKGRIYRVTPRGKASVFYQTKQGHVLCLATGPDHTLYAGTDKSGLVYRFDAQGKGFVLYHAPQSEVRSLQVSADGVYVGTSAPRRRGSSNSRVEGLKTSADAAALSSSSRSPGSTPTASADVEKGRESSESVKPKEVKEGISAPAPTPPGSGDNSLYRIGGDGAAREVFREKALILSMLRHHGRIFVGTGMEGQLFEVDEATRERSELARLDHGQIHCLYRRHDGSIVLGTGDPGKLYILREKYAAQGTVVSEVLDAKLVSKWGALRWQAETPPGTRVTVAVRSGNLAEPDETWSDWSAEQADPERAAIAAPPARYLQYRVTLATTDPAVSPALRCITLRYGTRNQAPEVTAIEVPDLDAANLDNPKRLRLKWTATDPNEDELTYSLFVRKEGWRNWIRLEEGLEKREYEWDTTTTPAGIYRLKVVASDCKDNPACEALTGQRISPPFAVAHTPPAVTLKYAGTDGDRAVIEATAADELVRLTAASFAVDGRKWVNVFPADGLFDRKTETFRIQTPPLKPGTHVIVLRVRDAAGNVGTGDAVFTIPPQAAAQK